MRRIIVAPIALTILLTCWPRPASAVIQFQKAFFAEYIEDHDNKEYSAFVKKKAKCWVCHQGKKRKNRNSYGDQLSELLDYKKDKKDDEKILAALREVAKRHIDPNDEKSETFGARIAAGKLPAADDLEQLKSEPKQVGGQ